MSTDITFYFKPYHASFIYFFYFYYFCSWCYFSVLRNYTQAWITYIASHDICNQNITKYKAEISRIVLELGDMVKKANFIHLFI